MRVSKRTEILDAAYRVVADGGVAAVTFDSVAEESSVTRGGILYHFPTKDELLIALHEHLAARWDRQLEDALGGAPDHATLVERLAAYASVSVDPATGPSLLLMLDAAKRPDLIAPWQHAIDRWVPPVADIDLNDPLATSAAIARLAADGLWLADSLESEPLPTALRLELAQRIAAILTSQLS